MFISQTSVDFFVSTSVSPCSMFMSLVKTRPGLPDHCIFGAKPLTVLFVFLCLLDDTNGYLALWLSTLNQALGRTNGSSEEISFHFVFEIHRITSWVGFLTYNCVAVPCN